MNQNWRDLIGGIFLVPTLHLGFIPLILLLRSIFLGSNFLDIVFTWFFSGIGISQFFYLIPVMLVFRRKNRFEVIKGISIGIVLTILINGLCFGGIVAVFGADFSGLLPVAFIGIAFSMLILYVFNRQSRPK
jgi:Na+/proline symporter